MTQAELRGNPTDLVGSLLRGSLPASTGAIEPVQLLQRIARGGIPGIALGELDERVRPQFFAEYLEAVVSHDPGQRHDRAELVRLARFYGASTARILNLSNVANEVSAHRETVAARTATLESLFLVHLLPAHRPNEHKVLTGHPKVHAADVGLAAWAARAGSDPSPAVFGALTETLVVNELAAQASWSLEPIEVRHWRDTSRKVEIDALLIGPDKRFVAVEVKASVDVRSDDLKGLRAYLSANPEASGVVFYSGAHTLQLDERINAVPLSALWSPMVGE
jgi:uncharacterized protein